MGVVYEAENLTLKRLVAIKVVLATDSAEALARLGREAQLVAAIQHPNICAVLDVGRLPTGGPYVVLERLFGETLADLLCTPVRPTVNEVIDIFVQALSGLHAAHAAHILHRDLKPQNLFLATRLGCPPLVKIVDFGFARDLSAWKTKRLTMPGKSCGTAQYMSPEQINMGALDARSDLFAIGIMMYEMLTGRHPFAGASKMDVQMRILGSVPRSLGRQRPDVPVELETIIMDALSKDPADRPRSAYEMQCLLTDAKRFTGTSGDQDEDPPSTTSPLWIPPSSTPF